MKEFYAVEKTPGGKMVGITASVSNDSLSNVKITGDFFMHPEDALSGIENALAGMKITDDAQAFESRVSGVVDSNSVELVGFTSETIANLAKAAIGASE